MHSPQDNHTNVNICHAVCQSHLSCLGSPSAAVKIIRESTSGSFLGWW